MAVVKSFKVGGAAVNGDQAASFDATVEDTEIFCFSRRHDVIEGVLLGEWAPNVLVTDSGMTAIAEQSKNTVYSSTTQTILVNGDTGVAGNATTLDAANVRREDCIIQFNWQDNSVSTALSQGRFYAYDKVSVTNAPTGTTVVGFERTSSAINKNRVGNDLAGKAWDADFGIGGRGNALSLSDQVSASSHTFYLGFSVKPTAYGSSPFALVIEFDVA